VQGTVPPRPGGYEEIRRLLESLPQWAAVGLGLFVFLTVLLWIFLPFLLLTMNGHLGSIRRNMAFLARDAERLKAQAERRPPSS
jgi:hypothetical protein